MPEGTCWRSTPPFNPPHTHSGHHTHHPCSPPSSSTPRAQRSQQATHTQLHPHHPDGTKAGCIACISAPCVHECQRCELCVCWALCAAAGLPLTPPFSPHTLLFSLPLVASPPSLLVETHPLPRPHSCVPVTSSHPPPFQHNTLRSPSPPCPLTLAACPASSTTPVVLVGLREGSRSFSIEHTPVTLEHSRAHCAPPPPSPHASSHSSSLELI